MNIGTGYNKKLTILWNTLTGYSVAFFKELSEKHGFEIQLYYQPVDNNSPFNTFDLSFCKFNAEDGNEKTSEFEASVHDFSPDCILMTSWAFPHYMKLAGKMRRRGAYVISAMDNQWHATLKQIVGVITSRWFLKPSIDTFLVAGDRQAYFARKLGYSDVMYGLYAAEIDPFLKCVPVNDREPNFIFVGRLIEIKGVKTLLKAYQRYRSEFKKPWGLTIAGTGPLDNLVKAAPGVKYLGFVQPDGLPRVMQSGQCLVLPSYFEPWGVVIHEAAAAGLPIIASYACGATTMFVRDGINGFTIAPNENALANALLRISNTSAAELESMSEASSILGKMWTPGKLAKYFSREVINRIGSKPEL